MTRHFTPPTRQETAPTAILIDATRCWRQARDAGHPIQPCLADVLAAHDCTMLAPVLDSLCLFYEAALGRPLAVGKASTLSEDEHLLLGLLDGSPPRACLDCTDSAASALDCALCSTRIMLALTLGGPAPTLQ
ncbi:hypothetical protein EEB18_021575 [Sphingopyxis sp. OPL5]|uniref:hypothetical protein n=1 Tax=Sphingopyxis sp. OPL5 TaxID=2486273 RepID=UPI00164E7C05|nr:hypothetical protein [Sphingopyxis sp. OPL5]QNO27260.1 hypothetical protein EEB18_021575 [Sphingopyxis sp. OPL5]